MHDAAYNLCSLICNASQVLMRLETSCHLHYKDEREVRRLSFSSLSIRLILLKQIHLATPARIQIKASPILRHLHSPQDASASYRCWRHWKPRRVRY